mmetsp:Transcript_62582/g.116394  ORF Transcript_62582/g.116394 Transcript_62582/m.116394 type:complete len:614 (-) Transcript_62582:86-1927(-)
MNTVAVPTAGGKVLAVGPTTIPAVFVALVQNSGFRYLQLREPGVLDTEAQAEWVEAASYGGEVAGRFGLHYHEAADDAEEDNDAAVSFLDASGTTWCFQPLPKFQDTRDGTPEVLEERVSRLTLKSPAIAACSMPSDELAFVLLQSGSLRFLNLATGTFAGKFLKLEQPPENSTHSLVPLGNGRVCLLRSVAGNADFMVASLDDKGVPSAVMHGSLPADESLGSLLGACYASGGEEGEARVVQCYGGVVSEEATAHRLQYTYVDVSCADPAAFLVEGTTVERTGKAKQPTNCWASVGSFLLEWAYPNGKAHITIRDLKQGLPFAQVELPFPAKVKECPLFALTANAGIYVSSAGDMAGVMWDLQGFSAYEAVGVGIKKEIVHDDKVPECVAPLLQALEGSRGMKRIRDDELEEMFATTKKAKTVDDALANEVSRRNWKPSHELVDQVIKHKLWKSAVAIIQLADADNALVVRLLVANLDLLGHVVRRGQSLHMALRDHMPSTSVEPIVDVATAWIQQGATQARERKGADTDSIPDPREVMLFMGEMVLGCTAALLLLPKEKIESATESMAQLCRDFTRMEVLHGLLRSAGRAGELSQPKSKHSATMEIWTFPL